MKYFYELLFDSQHLSWHRGYGHAKARAGELSHGQSYGQWKKISDNYEVCKIDLGNFSLKRYRFFEGDD